MGAIRKGHSAMMNFRKLGRRLFPNLRTGILLCLSVGMALAGCGGGGGGSSGSGSGTTPRFTPSVSPRLSAGATGGHVRWFGGRAGRGGGPRGRDGGRASGGPGGAF